MNKHHLWDGICLVVFDAQHDSFYHPEKNKKQNNKPEINIAPSNRWDFTEWNQNIDTIKT